ncbi:MAG: porphobilinogen synthase, partial [Opitutales bacterium]|nr:porphobilinogen synthase [Opitutales bacterium]
MEEKFKLEIAQRPRRLRRNASRLALCRETILSPSDLIQPMFVVEGKNKCEKIGSMPDICRLSIDRLLKKCETLLKLGVCAVALFPQVNPRLKNESADEALNPESVQNKAIRAVKKRFPEMQIVADIALDPYTSHGHDGILNKAGDWILNDETVETLCAMSAIAAQSGADFIAPSDMMDGRVGAIRETLDELGFVDTAIMA